MGIINAIPLNWKGILNGSIMSSNSSPCYYEKLIEKDYKTAEIYNNFIDYKYHVIEFCGRWENMLGIFIEYEQYLKLYTNIRSMTLSTKLRSFQYRLLNHGIVTNVQLHRWKITPTNLCTFCGLEPETILHLFFECPAATDIWNKLTTWVKNKTNRNIKFLKKNVIFCTAGQKAKDYVNTLCLITTL